MEIKFFGDYLLFKGVLTQAQYDEAVEFQSRHNLSLGKVALKMGVLLKDEIEEINKKQKLYDKKFGEVALEKGLIRNLQLENLLKKQKEINTPFGEVLVNKGFLSREELEKELENFEESQKERLKQVFTELAFIDNDNILVDSIFLFEKLYLRTTKNNAKIEAIDCIAAPLKGESLIVQNLKGDFDISFAFFVEKGVLDYLVSRLAKGEDKTKSDLELAGEFLNTFLENLAARFQSKSKNLKADRFEIVSSDDFDFGGFYSLDFLTTDGKLLLYIKI